MIDTDKYEGHTEGPWKAGIDCHTLEEAKEWMLAKGYTEEELVGFGTEWNEEGEIVDGDPWHEENFEFSLHDFHAIIPGAGAWRGARDGEWESPCDWNNYTERDPEQLKADLLLMADAPLLLEFYKEVKRIMDIDEILETSRVELIWIKLLEMSA